ncbi:MAG: glycosyltransferase, partial [Streptococcus sp.]|nr:glycosyltransferase [Streptococcus sp.]
MAKVSIIIPVYNTEDYLADCVKSLQKQSLQDIEIILVNDASTDRSLEIMTDFQKQDPRIKVISLDSNQGVGEARNQGLKVASGEFIAFVDSDDFVKADM